MSEESERPEIGAAAPEVEAEELTVNQPTVKPAVHSRVQRADLGTAASAGLTLLAAIGPFLFMAWDRRVQYSVPLTLLSLCFAAFGLLGAFRCFDRRVVAGASAPLALAGRNLATPLLRLLCSVALVIFVLRFAVAGHWPGFRSGAGVWVTASSLWFAVELFRFGRALGAFENGPERVIHRYGFWLTVIGCLLHLPLLGVFSLIDPWETHYGEVAREIVARDDWISLWWAQDGWFWSKPISNFWMQALSFKLFGVGYMPGAMLSRIGRGDVPHPEWACRIGVFALTQVATYVLYRATVAPFGKLAAFVGALILTTCPYWYMLARQTMADMVYVAPLAAALGFLLMAFQTEPEQRVRERTITLGRRAFTVSSLHLVLGLVIFTALPQILYLFSRQLTLHTGPDIYGFRPHLDEFFQGSGGGNCGQAGNAACTAAVPLYRYGQPGLLGLGWMLVLSLVVWLNRREARLQRVLFLAAWYTTALAVMGKGAPGLVIPLATALVYPVLIGRFRDLLRLELPSLLLLLGCVAFPWYVQMYMRHGWAFLDRLIMHDMVKRAFMHVHDTNAGDDTSFRYYIWQLGYGLFPWTGFAAAGLLWLGTLRESLDDRKLRAAQFLLLWWLVAFGMFSITLTKFHHYILPLLPPTALLAGVLVTEYLPGVARFNWRQQLWGWGGALLGALCLLLGARRLFPGTISGVFSDAVPNKTQYVWALLLLSLGCAIVVIGYRALRRYAASGDEGRVEEGSIEEAGNKESSADRPSVKARSALLSVLAIVAVGPVVLSGRDMFQTNEGDIQGQVRLLHLFTYNYARTWPESLDFRGNLKAFTLLCGVTLLFAAYRRWREYAVMLFSASAFWFSIWCVDVYFVRVSSHWGQRETMSAYYEQRKDDTEPLIAYQMNWKGENFYTGNRMATWVATGAKFKTWIKGQREKGTTTFFVTTEHSRVAGLKRELEVNDLDLLTTKELNDKFVLARVVFPPLLPAAAGASGTTAEGEGEAAEKPGSLE